MQFSIPSQKIDDDPKDDSFGSWNVSSLERLKDVPFRGPISVLKFAAECDFE